MTRQSTILKAIVSIAVSALAAWAQAHAAITSLSSGDYEHVFRHVLHLQAVDAAAATTAKPSNFSAYYKNLANLTTAQANAMTALSQAAVTALDAMDRQAGTVIRNWRAQMPSKLLPGQKPPSPPAELVTLQKARNALLDSYHTQLVQALGPTAFNKLDQSLIASYNAGPQFALSQAAAGQAGH